MQMFCSAMFSHIFHHSVLSLTHTHAHHRTIGKAILGEKFFLAWAKGRNVSSLSGGIVVVFLPPLWIHFFFFLSLPPTHYIGSYFMLHLLFWFLFYFSSYSLQQMFRVRKFISAHQNTHKFNIVIKRDKFLSHRRKFLLFHWASSFLHGKRSAHTTRHDTTRREESCSTEIRNYLS